MALIDDITFENTYAATAGVFADNTTQQISEGDMRAFAADIKDSLVFKTAGQNPDLVYNESYDWLYSGGIPMGWANATSGTAGAGAGADTFGRDSTEKVVGSIYVETGTVSTGWSAVYKGSFAFTFNQGHTWRFAARNALQTLSDGTNRYTVYWGFGDNGTTAGNMTDGVFFRYVDNVNSGKWEAVCRAAGVETTADTTIAADTVYRTFAITVNSSGTQATFFIDGVQRAQLTTNIPTGANYTGLIMKIEKSLGTTSRLFHQDWYSYSIATTTAR